MLPRIAAGVFALLAVAAAVVQLNDPDPAGWFAVYFSAALVAGAAAANRLSPWPPLALAALSAVWAATIAPRIVGTPGFPSFGLSAQSHGMLEPHVEETREMFGLLIVALTMAAHAAWGFMKLRK
jgi:hypothetical protein